MRLGLSTSWNASRHSSGKPLVFEIKDAGFDAVELSANLTSSMVREIEIVAHEIGLHVLSLHNYCPIPDGVAREIALPDFVAMSSCDQTQRLAAVSNTQNTIRTAAELGAKAVVLHCGRVEIPDQVRELITLYKPKETQTPQFLVLRDRVQRERTVAARPFFENTLRSLDTIVPFAHRHGIMLGIENRFYYREIPGFDEIGEILARFKGAPVHYWHDTGHAQVMENLGLARHFDFLTEYGSRIGGMHLHDVHECKDHLPLGEGSLDFRAILSYAPPQAIRILEVHRPATAEQLRQSKTLLESFAP